MSEDMQPPDGVSIHTGFPNPAIDASLRSLDLNKLLVVHGASTYFFQIQGKTWEDVGVFDGDLAIIDRALDPRRTDLVIWWDERSSEFAISKYTATPPNAIVWGVITAIIHQYRKGSGQ